MLMMFFLSIESSLGLAQSPEDQHYYCRPEACPQRLLNEGTVLLKGGAEAPESSPFPEYNRNACSEFVEMATGPLKTMS